MMLQFLRVSFWLKPNSGGLDLIDKIDALERQLRSHAEDAQAGERAPLFGDLCNDPSEPGLFTSRQIAESLSEVYAQWSEDETPEDGLSRFEYSHKPLRMAAQLLRDIMLFLRIGIVWLLDRWYRWLFVALPPGLYATAYKFITRELVHLHPPYRCCFPY